MTSLTTWSGYLSIAHFMTYLLGYFKSGQPIIFLVLLAQWNLKFLAHQDNRSPICRSCQECKKSCKHIAQCPEARRTLAFAQSMLGVEIWLDRNSTHPDLWSLLLWYLQGRGALSCSKCSTALNLPHIIQEFAELQDIIGWDNFVTDMVFFTLLPIQSDYLHNSKSSLAPRAGSQVSSHSFSRSLILSGSTNVSLSTTAPRGR